MRLLASLSAALTLAAIAAPALAASDGNRIRLAQAASGPPTSGWAAPGAPQPAQPGPPTSGWAPPSQQQAAPARPAAPPASGWGPPGAPAQGPAASFGPPGASFGPGPGAGGGPKRNCLGEIKPLLEDAEQKGKAIKSAAATKKQPVVCQAFRNLATAESKVIKYFEDHGAECGVPPEATKARKGNYAKIIEVRTKVCDVAAAPAKRAPSLSDALGTSRVPTISSDGPTHTRRNSTFDTLTGNPLAR